MAMNINKANVKLAAIYRPLNNIFMNKIMENIRTKYICKNQIKKGISGVREMLQFFKKNYSIALMVDQRVSEGMISNFFKSPSLTTTIPAQLVNKFQCEVVPIHIKRYRKHYFKMTVNKPIKFEKNENTKKITEKLNTLVERMILENPEQWIWSHNRWK